MSIKRDSIVNAVIEKCDCYEAVPSATSPGNYYHQVRNIRRQAIEAEPNGGSTLGRLTSDLERLWYIRSKELREIFDTQKANAHDDRRIYSGLRIPNLEIPGDWTKETGFTV